MTQELLETLNYVSLIIKCYKENCNYVLKGPLKSIFKNVEDSKLTRHVRIEKNNYINYKDLIKCCKSRKEKYIGKKVLLL